MKKNLFLSFCFIQGYSVTSEQLLQSSIFMSVLFLTAKYFVQYLEKAQDFAKVEGCGGEQRELVFLLPSRHQK